MAEEKKYNFLDESGLELLSRYLNELILFDDFRAAKNFSYGLKDLLSRKETEELAEYNPSLFEAYQNILIKAQFIALPLLTEPEVLELLNKNFALAFEILDYNLEKKIKAFLLKYIIPEERDVLKNKLKKDLLENNQIITKEPVIRYDLKIDGSIKNWLTDYIINLGNEIIEPLKLSQYLINGSSIKNLSQESREKVKKLFNFYERLKFSSASPLGAEENELLFFDNEWHVLEEGRFVKIKNPEIDKIVEKTMKFYNALKGKTEEEKKFRSEGEKKEEIKKIYQGDLKEQKEILEEEAQIKTQIEKLKTVAEKNKELALILERGLDQRDKIKSIACLRLLAEGQALDKLLTENRRFIDPFLGYLKKKEEEKTGLLEGFKLEPTAPNYLGLFLRYLLQDKLLLNENDAGRAGMQLANIFKKAGKAKYANLVYFDMGEGKFKWNL